MHIEYLAFNNVTRSLIQMENLGVIYSLFQCTVLAILIGIYFFVSHIMKKKAVKSENETKIFDLEGKYVPFSFIIIHIGILLLSLLYLAEIQLGKNVKEGKTLNYQQYCDITLIILNFGIHWIFNDVRNCKKYKTPRLIFLFFIILTTLLFEMNALTMNHYKVKEYNFFALISIEHQLFFALFIAKIALISTLAVSVFIKSPFTHYYTYEANEAKGFQKMKMILIKFQMMWPFLWPDSWMLRFYLLSCLGIVISTYFVGLYYSIKKSQLIGLISDTDSKLKLNIILKIFSAYGILLMLTGHSNLGNGILPNLRNIAWQPIKNHIVKTISVRVYSHTQGFPLTWFSKQNYASLESLINKGGLNVDIILSFTIFNVISPLMEFITAIALFIELMNLKFAVILGFTFATYLTFIYFTIKPKKSFSKVAGDAQNNAKSIGLDALINYETVKIFNNEKYEIKKYSDAFEKYENAALYESQVLSAIKVLQNSIVTIGFLFGCAYCIHDIIFKENKRDDLLIFLNYVHQLYPSLVWLGSYIEKINSSMEQIDAMISHLAQKSQNLDNNNDYGFETEFKSLELKDISFKYDSKTILRKVNFKLEPNQILKIMGDSGSGKTTLIRILSGLLDHSDGKMFLNGKEITTKNKRILRKFVRLVPQEISLFNATIHENFNYGKSMDGSAESIFADFNKSFIKQFASMKKGLSRKVQERGCILSGGEKQKIAWKRALQHETKILLVDEATSSLDEIEVNRWLEEKLNSSCCIIQVADRSSIFKDTDRILFLGDESAFFGTYLELRSAKNIGYTENVTEKQYTQSSRNSE